MDNQAEQEACLQWEKLYGVSQSRIMKLAVSLQ